MKSSARDNRVTDCLQCGRYTTVHFFGYRSLRRFSHSLLAIACVGLVAFIGWIIFGPQHPLVWRDAVLYDVIIASASLSALCVAKIHGAAGRPGRTAIALGLVVWSIGDVVWEVWRHNFGSIPNPSVDDMLYLSMYPCLFIGLLFVLRLRLRRASFSVRLDGLVVGLGVACLYSLTIAPVARAATGGVLEVAVDMAYPVGDLLLAVFALGLVAALGWQLDRFMVTFVLGCALFCVADTHYLLLSAAGTYREGTLFDAGWPAGLILWSIATRQPEPRGARRQMGVVASLVSPVAVALTAGAVLVVASQDRLPVHVVALAAGALLAVLVRTSITFREVADAAEARRQALTDDLTGLPNRRGLSQQIRVTMNTGMREDHVLMLLGLNRVREITEAFGYEVSDRLLLDVSRRLETMTGECELIVRCRENEFALWFSLEAAGEAPEAFAEKLLLALAVPFQVERVGLTIEASIGIARYPQDAENESDLMRHASATLARARRSRIPYAVSETHGLDGKQDRLILTEQLRLAIKSDQLICHYQPKVEIATGRVVGAEALVRWQHPDRGLLSPEGFLGLAQVAGFLGEVTRRVLPIVVKQCAEWARQGVPLTVSANLSVTDLLDVGLVGFVHELLERYALAPRLLVLEITEETFMQEPDRARDTLKLLHAMGIGLSIDDYGSGYSSLSYLQSIPADELKVDRIFVDGISAHPVSRSIATATVGLAHSLGMRLVAEGVESLADAQTLADLGCDIIQGYYFSRPLPAASFQPWLSANDPFPPIHSSSSHWPEAKYALT
jgi:diguanylate cyclase (GGDEF)-like protein